MRLTGEFKGVPYQLAKDVWEEYQRTNNAKLLDAFISRLGEGGENAVLRYVENCDPRKLDAAFHYFIEIIYERRRLRSLMALMKDSEDQCKVSSLPPELDTDAVRKYFAVALANGWMSADPPGYKWHGVGGKGRKAQLAYFCGIIFGYKWNADTQWNDGGEVPYEALEKLFSETRLDRALPQAYGANKPQPWRKFFDAVS